MKITLASIEKKFGKTAAQIVGRIVGRKLGWTSVESYVGRGADGGCISGGLREAKAARKLRDAGLVVLGETYTSRECRNGNGVTSWSVNASLAPNVEVM